MSSVSTKAGDPLPYKLKTLHQEGKPYQHAVMVCCDCPTHAASFPWVHSENPRSICEKFTRMGWEVYRNKARCPECKKARARQKHHFAAKAEALAATKASALAAAKASKESEAVKTYPAQITPAGNVTNIPAGNVTNMNTIKRPNQSDTQTHQPPVKVAVRAYLLIVYDDGTIDTRDVEGAKEMLFGDQTYLVIPR